MANESLLSPQLTALEEAMVPMAESFRSRTVAAPRRTEAVSDMIDFVAWHLEQLGEWARNFEDEINDRLAVVLADPAATPARARWTVAGLESRLDALLDDWDEVRQVDPDPGDKHGLRLLTSVYRDIAKQLQEWLDGIVEVLEDPLAAAEKRGLADEKTAVIEIFLRLRAPSQTRALDRWVEARALELERAARKKANRESWIVGILIGIGLGFLFGGDSDE